MTETTLENIKQAKVELLTVATCPFFNYTLEVVVRSARWVIADKVILVAVTAVQVGLVLLKIKVGFVECIVT